VSGHRWRARVDREVGLLELNAGNVDVADASLRDALDIWLTCAAQM
jgi:hypothetical protein